MLRLCFLLVIPMFPFIVFGQLYTVKGVITGGGKTLESAVIVITGTTIGTASIEDGSYHLSSIPSPQFELIISHIGFTSQRRLVIAKNPIVICNIDLETGQAGLSEIVFSGTSKATQLKENPLQLTLVSKEQIEQASENNLMDALAKNTSGLESVKTGPNVSKPFINGLGYNRVLTVYDGMRVECQQWGDEHGAPIDDYNIERAEIIKGPASLMYGSDAVAGVVHLYPPTPIGSINKIQGMVLTEYQSNNGLTGNAFRVGAVDKHWIWMLRGSQRLAKNYNNKADGYVYNTSFRTLNASGNLGYRSKKGISQLSFSFYDNLQGIPDGSRDSLTRQFTYQLYETKGENTLAHSTDDIKNRPILPQSSLNSYSLSLLHQRIQDYRLYTSNKYDIGHSELKLFLGWEQNNRREYDHPTNPQQAGMYVCLNSVNYDAALNAPTYRNFDAALGINGMLQMNKNMDATDFPIPDYNLFEFGAYVFVKWKYKKWTVAGGLRYDERQIGIESLLIKPNVKTGFYQRVPSNDTQGAILQFNPLSCNFEGTSASFGFTYNPNEAINIKANIAKGYRAPNITEISANGLDPGAHIVYKGNADFLPEYSIQEDISLNAGYKNARFA